MTRSWRDDAACLDSGELWYSEDHADRAWAKQRCLGCPVLQTCHDDVMARETGEPTRTRHGIAAGMAPKERRALDNHQRGVPETTPPAPCGTIRAAWRHRQRHETLDPACREASRAYNAARKLPKAPAVPKPRA